MLFEFDIKEDLLGEPEQWVGISVYAKRGAELEKTVVTTEPPEYIFVGHVMGVKDKNRVLVRVNAPVVIDSEISNPDAGFRFIE